MDSLEAQEKAAYYPAILLVAKARQSSSEKSAVQDPILSADTSSNEWRMLARTAVEEIIAPDVVAWMDDDDSYSDVQFMNRALKDIKARYTECVVLVHSKIIILIGIPQETALQYHRAGARNTRTGTGQITLHSRTRQRTRLLFIGQQAVDREP